jgi:hypothetical protein
MGRVPHLHLLDCRPRHASATCSRARATNCTRADPGRERLRRLARRPPHGLRAFDPAPEKRWTTLRAGRDRPGDAPLWHVLVQADGWDVAGPRYSPDGDRIAFSAQPPGLEAHDAGAACRVGARRGRDGGAWEVVSAEWDHEVHAPLHWEDDGQALLFAAEQQGRCHLWRFDLPDRRAEVVAAGGWVQGFDKAAGTLVTLADARPPGAPVRAAARRRAAPHRDASTTRCWRRAGDGAQRGALDHRRAGRPGAGLAHLPAGFDAKKKHPLLHNIHGGPHTARRQLPLPLEHAGLRRPGLRRRGGQLPRLVGLRLCLQGQHHAPLGRARAAGRRGRHRLRCWPSAGPTRRACSPPAAATAASWWRG